MAHSFTVQKTFGVSGKSFGESRTLSVKNVLSGDQALTAAKIGSLTTRTDNVSGTLTMNAGHGITTGARLDIYWVEAGVNGHRRGVTVGVVATNSVPISGGSGDNLPTAATAVTAMVPVLAEARFDGSDIKGLVVAADARAIFAFTSAVPAELGFFVIDPANTVQSWNTGDGTVNPLAGDVVERVYMSHGDSTGTRNLKYGIGYD